MRVDGRRPARPPQGAPDAARFAARGHRPKARPAPWQAPCWRRRLAASGDPFAVERVEARADDDRRADDHRAVGHVAENDEAEQDRPEQRGVAERRDEGDVAGAHRHDDELVADEKQHRRQRQQRRALRSDTGRPAAHRRDQAGAADRHQRAP